MESIIVNCEDDEEELEEYKAFFTKTKFEQDLCGCPILAESLKKAWNGLATNDTSEGTFLPIAIKEAIRLSDTENAVIRGLEMDDEFDISFFIKIPKNDEFDSSKLKFVSIDVDYEDYSSVLQEHLCADMTCLNLVIYDGVMYFASDSNTLLDGGYTDYSGEVYDYVDTKLDRTPQDDEVVA